MTQTRTMDETLAKAQSYLACATLLEGLFGPDDPAVQFLKAQAIAAPSFTGAAMATKEWNDTVWAPHLLEVAGVDIVGEFPDEIEETLADFTKSANRLPHSPKELDAYAGSAQEWASYKLVHSL